MMKKKEFNGQLKHKLKAIIPKCDYLQSKKISKKEVPNKLKVNLSSSLKYIIRKKNSKKITNPYPQKSIFAKILSQNLQKHNSDIEKNNIIIINNLIKCKSSHFLAVFKDYLIIDYVEEFLRRIYFLNESIQRMPKLYNYYRNYLTFFCKPTFIDQFSNEKIKNYGDLNAECFYKNNINRKRHMNNEKKILDKNIIMRDRNNKNNEINNNNELIKTIFTKSIKNSIDNINIEDSTINNKKKGKNNNDIISDDMYNKNQQDSIINTWGCENGNLISEGNSLLLMIDEIKDFKNRQKITEKTISISKIMANNIKEGKNKDNMSKGSKSNLTKISKYAIGNANASGKHLDSLEKMIYSPKAKKNAKFSIKKDNNRYLSPKNDNRKINSPYQYNTNINNNTIKNDKNQNSIVVNINININTNKNTNTINENAYKSPVHGIKQKRLILSPVSPIVFNLEKKSIPLSTTRNKGRDRVSASNYVKITQRKNDFNNLVLLTNRNKKKTEFSKLKTVNSIDSNEAKNKQNYTYNNKDMLLYGKKNNNEELYNYNRYNGSNINKNVYFSPKNVGSKFKFYNKSMKELENSSEINNNKKYIYQKKQNTINSPLNKNSKLNKKFFSYRRLNNANSYSKLNLV
jgi:hypothetical protein